MPLSLSGGEQAAMSRATEERDGSIARQLGDSAVELMERNPHSARDDPGSPLRLLANVDQH